MLSQISDDAAWLSHHRAFAVSPALDLLPGTFIHKSRSDQDPSVFFAMADTLPGAWAQQVIGQACNLSSSSNATQRPLTDIDLLCAVNDMYRLGALRVLKGALPFLMAHGASLGGSRPKVSVIDANGFLWVAKLPRLSEKSCIPLAEVLAMKRASRAGIDAAHAEAWGGVGRCLGHSAGRQLQRR